MGRKVVAGPQKSSSLKASGEVALSIRYVNLDEAVLWERNPKEHDLALLRQSVRRYGFRDAPIFDEALGAIVAGNGRTLALRQMKAEGEPRPAGVLENPEGAWLVPLQFGVNAASAAEAEAFGVDHNNLTAAGGTGGMDALLALWQPEGLASLFEDLKAKAAAPLTLTGEDFGPVLEWDEPAEPVAPDAADGAHVRPVLAVQEVEVFERAVAATGLYNRGEAVLAICRAYLKEGAGAAER